MPDRTPVEAIAACDDLSEFEPHLRAARYADGRVRRPARREWEACLWEEIYNAFCAGYAYGRCQTEQQPAECVTASAGDVPDRSSGRGAAR